MMNEKKREIPLSKIEPNKFNPNVMSKEEFAVLCQDMKITGPKHELVIDDLLVSPKRVFYNDPDAEPDVYVIIDGENRWKSAKVNGWQTVPCEIRNIGEDLALIICYRRNKERGHIDPLREAALFKREEEKGLTHDRIARAYMVDRTTVTKRIALLNITDDTLKRLAKVPHGTIRVSHLEPLSTLKPELQKTVTERIEQMVTWGRPITVSAIENFADNAKAADKERRKLEVALKKAKFSTCPKCENPPIRIDWEGLPFVRCENRHDWSLKTGKAKGYSGQDEEETEETKPEQPKIPKTVRSFITVEVYKAAIEEIIKAVVPQFTEITNISVRGTLQGAESDVHARLSHRIYFSYSIGSSGYSVSMESHDYRDGEKTKVYNVWPNPQSEKDVKKINDFLKSLKEKTLFKKEKTKK